MSGLEFEDMKKLQQQLKKQEQEFDGFIHKFLLKMALDAVGRAKSNTPVDTGLLRAAWSIGDVQRQGNNLMVALVNPIEYASFVEYGHMTRDRNHWVEGKFMATLAIDEVARLIPARFQTEYAAWLARLGA